MRRFILPVIFGALVFGFWISPDFQEIAAGVAIFLFGMLMLEDGFRLFGGGFLERILGKATDSTPKSLLFGIVSTTLMQSSSLVSVITISFLSAGLLSLTAGVGIIFGANIGTTTGAWLIAGFGLKVKISAYAMPMLVFGIILAFQSSKYLKGAGYVLAGLGFLFLGIHYMKEGFETFKDQFDLARFAMTGLLGLVVYTLIGAAATVVMQSSHATMVLIITALAAGQITYENALALAIGANIGTTITAIIGSLTSNYQGKRLALAHLIFNLVTAGVALIFINQIRDAVNWVSAGVGIADDDYALKLAVFHSIFNVLGVALMTPLIGMLIKFLERTIPQPKLDVSAPRYLSKAADEFPATIEVAMHNEVRHLYDNAVELIAHGLNLHRTVIFQSQSLAKDVAASREVIEFDLDARYNQRVKSLYAAIVEFASQAGAKDLPQETVERIYNLRDIAAKIVRAVKSVKHLRRNVTEYTSGDENATAREVYNQMRTQIARILVEIENLERTDADERSSLWLDSAWVEVEEDYKSIGHKVDDLMRKESLDATAATSFLNDSGYAYNASRNLIDVGRQLYAESEEAMAEVERILGMDEDDDVEPETVAEARS